MRRQYLPAAAAVDTGKRCIYGKTPLRGAVLDGLPAAFRDGFTAVMRDYGYAAVTASSQAEAETGMRRNRLMFWLYRRMAGTPA